MKKILIVLAILAIGAVIVAGLLKKGAVLPGASGKPAPAEKTAPLAKPAPIEFQKGMGYCGWSKSGYLTQGSDDSLDELFKTGAEWISVLVTYYQTNVWATDVKSTENTPSDEAVLHVVQKAHDAGKKVMFKLHLDILDQADGSWRGDICARSEDEWQQWSKAYTDFVMHYVDLARQNNVEMICIGTELNSLDTTKGPFWSDLARKIRKIYSGKLTYAAHWDNYYNIRFWRDLDFIGINAYFPLSEKNDPSLEEMKEAWKKWLAEIEEFQAKEGKPVIFPEAGCNSADDAAIKPWEHTSRGAVNLRLQKDYYTALLETFFDKEWFYGAYWWYWATSKYAGGQNNKGFMPQNKPAQEVVKEWYSKTVLRGK